MAVHWNTPRKRLVTDQVLNSLASVHFYDIASPEVDFTSEIIAGLSDEQKFISPKFFYDETGSELFTEITRQPEYYLTKTETVLLKNHAEEISELIGDDILLVEYGSGSSEKIRILLENLRPSIYAPVDISRDYLAQAAEAIASEYPWLEVHATVQDFTQEFRLPFSSEKRRVSFFPGSSIGNFSRPEAANFVARIRGLVGDDGGLLIGVDLKKDEDILNAAYNDAAGVTAKFNLNILSHLNDRYDADFDLSRFTHHALYNDVEGCIQMFLISQAAQVVTIGEQQFEFAEGEAIHTENSHKYDVDEFLSMAEASGFGSARTWLDKDELFAVLYLSN